MNDINFRTLLLADLTPSPTNPRKHFDATALAELADSIAQQGLAQPILVRPILDTGRYEIVAGERRYRASSLAGLSTIIAVVRNLSDLEALELQVIENLQRADLHPMEEAQGYAQLMQAHNFTADQLADKVGKSKSYIYNRLKLLDLAPAGQEAFYAGKLTPATALLVARIPVPELQARVVAEITSSGNYNQEVMTAKQAAHHIHLKYMLQLKQAPFKTGDATLVPAAGACGACPKRTGNQPLLFEDIESLDTCTDPDCFELKREAGKRRTLADAKQAGQNVIRGVEARRIMPNSYSGCSLSEGYVAITDTCFDDVKKRTFAQILGKSPAVSLMEDPHRGTLIKVVKIDDIRATLAESGIRPRASVVSDNTRQRALEAKVKAEKEYRRRLFIAVRDRAEPVIDRAMLNDVATRLYLNSAYTERPFMAGLYEFQKSMVEYPGASEKTHAVMAAMDDATINRLILDCMLLDELSVSHHTPDGKPEKLLAAAARVGVDPGDIRASIKAEVKAKLSAKAGAKKKPAAKKTASTVPA
jgi:ParB/RepB/Spo0J family partition protein